MPGKAYQQLFEIASDQYGYVTTAQAAQAGVERHALIMMARRGELEPESYGVYRVAAFPVDRLNQYMAATLWPYGTWGVLSHDTALELYELSDVSPAKIHLTLPKAFRVRRQVPGVYVIHHTDLPPEDITTFEGIPVTTPARAIRDCHARHLGPALIRQAIEDGRRTGRLRLREADELERELLPDPPSAAARRAS